MLVSSMAGITKTNCLLSIYCMKSVSLGTKLPFRVTLIRVCSCGRRALIGSLLAFMRVEPPDACWILPYVNSWAISPENLLNVLGIRISGLISIVTPLVVLRKTCSLLNLFSGLSSRARRVWWAISGLKSSGLFFILAMSLEWSSQFRSSTPFFVYAVSNDLHSIPLISLEGSVRHLQII